MHYHLRTLSLATATLLLSLFTPLLPLTLKFEPLIVQAQTTQDRATEVQQLLQKGSQQYRQAQLKEALATFQQALGIYQQIGDKAGEAEALNHIGEVYNQLSQNNEALKVLQQALAIRQELKDRKGEGETLDNIGEAYDGLSEYPKALAMSREVGDRITQDSPEGVQPDKPLDQVPSVSQLSDVQPTDWAFEALRSLSERYGCLAGYPDSTFRGNRAIKRYEFAAGLNACLSRMIALGTETKEDFLTLQKLQDEFATELALLRDRVDVLEARTTKLEATQFSTTVLLRGEAIFGLAMAAGGNPPGRGETNTVLNYQTRLNFVTSFTGKDRLLLSLVTGNFDNLGFANANSFNTYMAQLNYQTGLNNQVVINNLEYRLATFGDRVVLTFKPVGFSLSDVLTANSPYVDAGQGSLSRFAALSPVFQIGALDSGLGFDWLLNGKTRLQVAYGTRNSGNITQGLFASDHSTLGVQLLLKPTDKLAMGFAYVNAYSSDGRLDTFTGSFNADTSGTFLEPAQIHALNATLQWRLASKVSLGAWGGLIYTHSLKSQAVVLSGTALLSLGISDPLGRPGDLLVVLVGVPPKLVVGGEIQRIDRGTSVHIESFYRLRLTDNLSISPGLFVVTSPGHISQNQTIFIGVIRTNFSF
jgi:tetratricopeptide (TPR) repeat protein